MTPNQFAFLALLSHSEGTDRVPDPYRVCFGFRHYIVDLSDHPAVTGEWLGEPIGFLGPQYAGEISTAAGRFQINKRIWLEAKLALRLPDFMPPAQCDAALWLIRDAGALALVNEGNIIGAIGRCRNIWASLPGGNSGEPEMKLALLLGQYTAAGGTLAAAVAA